MKFWQKQSAQFFETQCINIHRVSKKLCIIVYNDMVYVRSMVVDIVLQFQVAQSTCVVVTHVLLVTPLRDVCRARSRSNEKSIIIKISLRRAQADTSGRQCS